MTAFDSPALLVGDLYPNDGGGDFKEIPFLPPEILIPYDLDRYPFPYGELAVLPQLLVMRGIYSIWGMLDKDLLKIRAQASCAGYIINHVGRFLSLEELDPSVRELVARYPKGVNSGNVPPYPPFAVHITNDSRRNQLI